MIIYRLILMFFFLKIAVGRGSWQFSIPRLARRYLRM